MRAIRHVDEDLKGMRRDAFWKFTISIWSLMVVSAIIMISFAVSIGRDNNHKLERASVRFDEAFEFDFAAFATSACRTCDGSELIIHADTPIVVQPFLSGNRRQFPEGFQNPCFSSKINSAFEIRTDATLSSTEGMTVDASTVLDNPQGLRSIEILVDCGGGAPCLPGSGFCETEFGMEYPYGPIYHYTRTNVGSNMDTLKHLCVCILDWDPVSEMTVTLPYCTEPLA